MVDMGKWVADTFESVGVGRVSEVRLEVSTSYNFLEMLGIPVESHYVRVKYQRPDGLDRAIAIPLGIFHRWYGLSKLLVRMEIRRIQRSRAAERREEADERAWSWRG